MEKNTTTIETVCHDLKTMDPEERQAAYTEAGEVIRRGGTVAFPTETVYGLGADAMNEEAVKAIFNAKGRPSDNPLIIHVADQNLKGIVKHIPETAHLLMDQFWPGPLTIIMAKDEAVPDVTTAGLETVGVRMPDQEAARELILASGRFIAAPSANISGRPSPTTYERCIEDLTGRVDMILGMDQSRVGLESTIIDVTGSIPELLRPGAVTLEMLKTVLGDVLYRPHELQEGEAPRAPGMKYRHYAPKARVTVFRGESRKVRERMRNEQRNDSLLIFIGGDPDSSQEHDPSLVHFKNTAEASHELFENLRRADDAGYLEILIEAVPEEGLGLSLMNRIKKAASYDIVEVDE